ncbi:MAG: hypothetical protein AB7O56_05935 [Bauldia sp.]
MAEYRQPAMDWNVNAYEAPEDAARGLHIRWGRVIALAVVLVAIVAGAYFAFFSGGAPAPAEEIRQAAPTPEISPDMDKPGM